MKLLHLCTSQFPVISGSLLLVQMSTYQRKFWVVNTLIRRVWYVEYKDYFTYSSRDSSFWRILDGFFFVCSILAYANAERNYGYAQNSQRFKPIDRWLRYPFPRLIGICTAYMKNGCKFTFRPSKSAILEERISFCSWSPCTALAENEEPLR